VRVPADEYGNVSDLYEEERMDGRDRMTHPYFLMHFLSISSLLDHRHNNILGGHER
jgi:hypothetical protein